MATTPLTFTRTDQVHTTDATVTTIALYTLPDETIFEAFVLVVARTTGGVKATYQRTIGGDREGGAAATAQASTTTRSVEDVAGWDVTADASGNDIRLRVTGAAATAIDWLAVTWGVMLTTS